MTNQIKTTDSYLTFRDWKIFIRNKKLANAHTKVLFCMGATYHTSAYFDLSINGQSAMDYLALAGFDVYCYDMLGMGKSSKPNAFDVKINNFNTTDGLSVIERVYDHIAVDHDTHVIGYSWGSIATMMLANKRSIPSLTLLGARYPTEELLNKNLSIENIQLIYPYSTESGFYRVAEISDISKEWQGEFTDKEFLAIVDPGTVKNFFKQMLAHEPSTNLSQSQKFLSPKFTKNDVKHFIYGKMPFADAALVTCPCLLVCAPDEKQMSEEIFNILTTKKEYLLVPSSTHWGLIECNRFLMLDKIIEFINNQGSEL